MITLLLPLLLAAPQEQQQPIYKLEDLIISNYQPQFVDVESLYSLANNLLERNLQVGDRYVTNLNFMYDRILIYETPEATKRILAMMKQIDQGFEGTESAKEMEQIQQPPKLTDFPVQEYRVRSLNVDAVFELLNPYQRSVLAVDSTGGSIEFSNLNRVIDNVLLIRDTLENTAAMMDLLEKFDRPAPQAQISVWVLRGGGGASGSALPAELSKSLQQLIPDLAFHLDARGLLRTAIGPDLALQIELSGESGDTFSLSLSTGPYDDQSGSLSLTSCNLMRSTFENHVDQLFRTTTSVRAGEYAVIGVTGSDPVLLALRLQILP